MVKLVDTLVSGTSGRKAVQVRVLFRALKKVGGFPPTFFSARNRTGAFGSFIHPLLNPPRWGGLGRFAPIVGAPNGYGIYMRRRISFAFQEIYITFAISLSVLTKLRQASSPKWMSVFLNCYRGEVVIARSQLFLHIVNTQLMKMRTRCTFVIISIRAEIVRLARIKVIALLRFGKIERA